MVKKLQVFVSSTFIDLKEERQKAVEGILQSSHIPAGMELFSAGSRRQWDVIQDWIKESDILMLILGGRYGSIDSETELGYTEMEYRFAKENNIPVFAVVLSDQFLADKKSKNITLEVNETVEVDKYKAFKELVTSNLVKFVDNIDQITSAVAFSLNNFVKEDESIHKFRGWVRPSDVVESKNVLNEGENKNSNSKLLEKDEEMLSKIINIIEEQHFVDTIGYIYNHCAYLDDMKRKLDEFLWLGEAPSTGFFNKKVQDRYNELLKSINNFSTFLGQHFFTKRGGGIDTMYLYPDLNEDFASPNAEERKRYDQYVDRLFNVGQNAINDIKSFAFDSQKALYS